MPPRTGKQKIKYSTFADGCYKSLGSLPVPREGWTVPSMDLLISRELEGNVVFDSSSPTYILGHTVDVIFKSFASDIRSILPLNSLESLTVPCASIPEGVRSTLSPAQLTQPNWSMYDLDTKRWRWSFEPSVTTTTVSPAPLCAASLPASDSAPHIARHGTPTSEQLVAHFFNSIALAVKEKVPNIVRDGTKRHWMAEWSHNSLPGSTAGYNRKPDLILVDNSAFAVDEVSWWSPRVLAEYTKETFQPVKRLGKTMDTKAYLTFLEQPWRRFVLGLSICNGADLRLHFYDRSGGAVSPAFNIHSYPERLIYILCAITFGGRGCLGFDVTVTIKPVPARIRGLLSFLHHGSDVQSSPTPLYPESHPPPPTASDNLSRALQAPTIGTILVGDVTYDIIDILFSSPGFLGRGTVCYLARRANNLYVIKDHWVRLSPHQDLLNEVKIMDRLRDIVGVPQLHSHWIVVADGAEDYTERYREERWRPKMKSRRVHLRLVMTPYARPLMVFKSKKELVLSLRDIVKVLQRAADAGVLHRDCSLHNASIEDLEGGGSRGLLLDWEFGAEVNETNTYSVGGTGTLPFMSINLLEQLRDLVDQPSQGHHSIRKTMSSSCVFLDENVTVNHTHADDLESLFYVLVWIMILYDGPLGQERKDVDPNATVLGRWTDDSTTNLATAADAKTALLLRDNRWKNFHKQIAPYFSDLLPLADEWRTVIAKRLDKDPEPNEQFLALLAIFDKFIPTIPDEDPEVADTIKSVRDDYMRHIASIVTAADSESDARANSFLTSQKRLELSEVVRSTDNPPRPSKRFRRTY